MLFPRLEAVSRKEGRTCGPAPTYRGGTSHHPPAAGTGVESEVLGHEPVVAAEGLGTRRARPGLHRQCCEVQAGRPALCPFCQVVDLGRVERGSCCFEQPISLLLVEPEILNADLVHRPLCSPAGKRQLRLLPARDRDQRSGGDIPEQLRQGVQTGPVGDGVEIVECQHQRVFECRECAPDTWNAHGPGAPTWPG